MTDVVRVRIPWTGSSVVGPSVSTFYGVAATPTAITTAIADMFDALVAWFPTSVNWTIPGTGDVIDDETGDWVSSWSTGAGGVIHGTDSGLFAQGVGFRTVWETNGRTANRRVRGSTFFCPSAGVVFDTDGTLKASARTAITDAMLGVSADLGPDFVVWSKPTETRPGKVTPITGVTIPDRVSWLVSRRT